MRQLYLYTTCVFFIGLTCVLNAQRYDWVSFTPTTGSNGSGAEAVSMDDDGFLYTISRFEESVEIGQSTVTAMGFGFTDYALIKWNSDGQPVDYLHLYSAGFNGIYDMTYDSQQHHVVISFSNLYEFTIEGQSPVSTGGNPVLRFTEELDYVSFISQIWTYNEPLVCSDSALYLASGYNSSIKKYSASNDLQWSLAPVTGSFNIRSLATDGDSVLYAFGYFMEQLTVTYGDSAMSPPPLTSGQDVGIIKVDTSGVVMDAFYLGRSQSYNNPIVITTDDAGFVYVACPYSSAQTLGAFEIPASTGSNDVFIAKLSPEFEFLWVTTIQNQASMECRGLTVMDDGTLAITGLYGGVGTFGQYVFNEPNPFGMGYMALLDPNTGELTYADIIGNFEGTSRPYDIISSGQEVYISGLLFSSSPNQSRFGCYTASDRFFFLTKFNNEEFVFPVIELNLESSLLVASTNLPDPVFEWTLNGEILEGITGSSYAPQSTGTYTVSVSTYGCLVSDTEVITQIEVGGCMNVSACNYNENATFDDGSCDLPGNPCDDGNPLTVNDQINGDCICTGEINTNGCTDITACNYNGLATIEDGSCLYIGEPCDDGNSETINDTVTGDCACSGSLNVPGCTDIDACNFNVEALTDDGSCLYLGETCDDGDDQTVNDEISEGCVCAGEDAVLGCLDSDACNYNPNANTDDASCIYVGDTCDDGDPETENDIVGEDCICQGLVGIMDVNDNAVALYPNPANETIWIEVSSGLIGNELQIYQTDGRLLHSERITGIRQTLSVGEFSSGVYRLVISDCQGLDLVSRTFLTN